MSRRLGAVGVIMLTLFIVLAAQVVYLQFFHADALNKSGLNPRVETAAQYSARGSIYSADGALLASVVASAAAVRRSNCAWRVASRAS